MRAGRRELTLAEIERRIEAAVVRLLLSSEHSPWSGAEPEREVAGVSGNPLDVTDAINRLYGAKLVNLSGELVTPTRAARSMDELRLGLAGRELLARCGDRRSHHFHNS